MTVRAKFRCDNVIEMQNNSGFSMYFSTVYDSNPETENGKFFKYTPAGQIVLHVVNEDTAEKFKRGKEYYIDFIPVNHIINDNQGDK